MQPNRPLKCKLCGRRFAYAKCLFHHLVLNHYQALVTWRETKTLQMKESIVQRRLNLVKRMPLRVSVIKRNFQAKVSV